MALITYVLIVGYVLGQMHQFTPEQLGVRICAALLSTRLISWTSPPPFFQLSTRLLACPPRTQLLLLLPARIPPPSMDLTLPVRPLQGTLSSTFGWLAAELIGYRTAFYVLNIPWRST